MKKLLLFGSFFLISFFTGLVKFHGLNAQAYGGDGYGDEVCTASQNCGFYGNSMGEDGEYHNWYNNTGYDDEYKRKCCATIAIDDEGNRAQAL